MTMRSPVLAMMWELWRLTRIEVAWRLALGIVAASAVLVLFAAVAPSEASKGSSAVIALVLIVAPQFVFWMSFGKLTSNGLGFPLHLLYTRPVRTAAIVGVPMVYLAAAAAASYLTSALLLRLTSGYPFPLLPVAAWIAALHLGTAAATWSTRSRVVMLLGTMATALGWMGLAQHRLNAVEIPGLDWPPSRWPALFDFPLTDYLLIGAIGLASFGLTVAGVARQRHGDTLAPRPWRTFPDWLFRFQCPTSSATRAQVWFELRSSGMPLLTIGLVLAIVTPLLFALSVPVVWFRPIANMFGVLSVVVVCLSGTNAYGLRWKQGRLHGNAFETTQPYGTTRLAGIKVLVRSACVLAALVVVGASVWASMSLIAFGTGYEPLRSWQRAIESAVGALTGYQQIALAAVASIGVAVMVALHASLGALVTRYRRHHVIGTVVWLVLLHGAVLIALVLNGYRGVGSKALWEFLLAALVWVTRWIDAPAIVLVTVYVFWKTFGERLLTLRSACGAVLVSVAFGAAWVTVLRAAGVQMAGMSTADAVWMLSPILLPLTASVLAPWSLNRIRHT